MILKKVSKQSKGITLIALVITIIVLLILAGVSIAMLTGENGILTQASKAKNDTDKQGSIEQVKLDVLASLDSTGKIDYESLEDNLKLSGVEIKYNNDNNEIDSNSFPLEVILDNIYMNILLSGDVIISDMNEKAYAIIYDTGETLIDKTTNEEKKAYELVFQRGNAVDNTKSLIEMYTDFETLEDINLTEVSDIPWDKYRTNIINVNFKDVIKPNTIKWWFFKMENCLSINMKGLNTKDTESFRACFSETRSLTNIDVTNLNTCNTTSLAYAFSQMDSCTDIKGIENWDTSNVTDFAGMFQLCKQLKDIDVSHFNTSKGTKFEAMFDGMYNITFLDLSNFDVSNGEVFACMFRSCENLKELIGLDKWKINYDKAARLNVFMLDMFKNSAINSDEVAFYQEWLSMI